MKDAQHHETVKWFSDPVKFLGFLKYTSSLNGKKPFNFIDVQITV